MRRFYFLVIFFIINIIVYAQDFDAGDDQEICIGESTQLQGSGPWNYTYQWTSIPNDPTISNPNILTPTVQPSTTTIYSLEGRFVSNINLVENGDFEDGNTGFTSSYIYSPGANGLWNEGTYAITNDASFNHDNFTCDNDHTSGNGMFMAVNGASTPNTVIWTTTVYGLTQNSDYEFSTWVMSLTSASPAVLQFRINGVLLGEPFTANSTICVWKQFFEEWNSGTSNSAEISIVNQNTQPSGNDFSLDDIRFSKVNFFYDDCTVTVNPIPTSTFEMPANICSVDTALITYTGNALDTDIYNWDFDGGNIISGSGQGPYEVQWDNAGIHQISLIVNSACESPETIEIINIQQSPEVSLTADLTTVPYGTPTTLHALMDGSPGPLEFIWDPIDMLQDATILDPMTQNLEQTTLFTFLATDNSSMCYDQDTITIVVEGGPLEILDFTSQPDTICIGESSVLNIDIVGGSGVYDTDWTSAPNSFNYQGEQTSHTVSPTETTTYSVLVTDGFANLPMVSLKVVVLPQIEVLENPKDTLIEVNQTAVFKAEGSNLISYQWQESMDNGLSWTDLTDNLIYSGTNTNQLTISNANIDMNTNLYRCEMLGKCDPIVSDDALLTIISSPTFSGHMDDVEICQNESFSINCSFENFSKLDSFNIIYNYDPSFLEFLSIDNIHPDIVDLTVSTTANSIVLNWNSPIGKTLDNSSLFQIKFTAISSGYTMIDVGDESIVRNSYGFYPPMEFTPSSINILSLALMADFATATPDSLNVFDEEYIELEAIGGAGETLIWSSDSCGANVLSNDNPFTIFQPEATTTYFARWKNQCGISDCVEVSVKISEDFSFAIPNAFSPDGDGLNDDFGVVSLNDFPYFNLKIFNRWGQLIFESNSAYEMWDGTYNGQKSPMGTYVWKAVYQYRLEGPESQMNEQTGMVSLIR